MRALPSGRATCPPTLPNMVNTSRSISKGFDKLTISPFLLTMFAPLLSRSLRCKALNPKVFWGVSGPIKALVGPCRGPREPQFLTWQYTALDHSRQRALIAAVISKSLTNGDHNWQLSLDSIKRTFTPVWAATIYSVL